MRIIILIDNSPHPSLEYKTEHGLSIYFEVDGYKWLYDVGASGNYYFNALKMGIDIGDVDFLVLSHGHNDHTGRLEHFLSVNKKAQIIISAQIKEKSFYSHRHIPKRNIGIDHSVVKQNIERFIFIEDNKQLSKNVFLVCKIPLIYKTPVANKTLFVKDLLGERLDEFKHEMALGVNTDEGVIVFSSCSHNGILNILDAVSGYTNGIKVTACVGGTHIINGDSTNRYESESDIREIAASIINQYPGMQLITGHCTGTFAQKAFSETMNNKFKTFYSGTIITV